MKKISTILSKTLFVFFCISTVILIQIFWQSNQKKFLEIVFLDVGQGDAILIETPNGFKTLIDAGPNSTVVRALSKFVPFYEKKIDLLVATHSDSDHVAGFVEVLKRFKIKTFAKNFVQDSDALNTEINNLIELSRIDQYFLKSGDKIILDKTENIYIEILWPPPDKPEKDNNDNSVITRIVYGETEIMLTGDASTDIEEKIINNLKNSNFDISNKLQSDILKAGHHGSRTSTSVEFLELVKPEYVIISAGKDNRFGHPHKEVLDRIIKSNQDFSNNKKILETYVLGSIHFRSDGKKLWLVD